MCGGFTGSKQADADIQLLADSVKVSVEAKLNAKFETYEAVSYKSQIVNGTNYNIKVKVDDNNYIHIKVHKALPCYGGEATLSVAEAGVSLDAEINL